MPQGEDERGSDAGTGSEGEPGSGVVVAFGRQLKLLRVQAGLGRAEFGRRTGYAPQSVASFEQGRRIPQSGFIDRAEAAWFKSSYSGGGGGECVEVAAVSGVVHVRDSKVAAGPVLAVTPEAWTGFVGMAVDALD